MVKARIAVAPLFTIHRSLLPLEIREVEPIVRIAYDRSLVAPIIIPLAVRGEVHHADLGMVRVRLIILSEALPQIVVSIFFPENALQN